MFGNAFFNGPYLACGVGCGGCVGCGALGRCDCGRIRSLGCGFDRCCCGCDNCETFDAGDPAGTDINTPCCRCDDPCACDKIAGDMPWLKPRAIACGRTKVPQLTISLPVLECELDNGALPGRPPHTITCVRATGTKRVTIVNASTDEYDLELCVMIPVEVIIRDCAGFTYCLHSEFSRFIRIPLCGKLCWSLGMNTMAYVKTRVCLCEHVIQEYNGWGTGTASIPGCEPSTIVGRFLTNVTLSVLLEICLVRLLPYATLSC